MPPYVPSDEDVLSYVESLSNWGRWGKDDEIGTMNLVTGAKKRQAAGLVKEGISVGCARTITTDMTPDAQFQPMHYMVESGEGWEVEGARKMNPGLDPQDAMDFIGFVFHGHIITHIDIPGHFFWKSRMYNGRPAHLVSTFHGATVGSIETLRDGVVSRGVLLDIPKARGVDWLEPRDAAFPEDLEAAEKMCGVRVGEGDILLVRTGHTRRRKEKGPWDTYKIGSAAPHAACLPWYRERGVAMLGSDTSNDVRPPQYQSVKFPNHQIGLVAMGQWLIDNCDLDDLAETCEKQGRWEFMLTIGPLRIKGGTGSPVNPIAIF